MIFAVVVPKITARALNLLNIYINFFTSSYSYFLYKWNIFTKLNRKCHEKGLTADGRSRKLNNQEKAVIIQNVRYA